MSESDYAVIVCDGDNGWCGAVALDHTGHGIARLEGSDTQLPEGWTGPRPGSRDGGEHLCPTCSERAR